jgi:cytochrome c1
MLVTLLFLVAACGERAPGYALIGDTERGHALVERYGCPACHVIPGSGTRGLVGPPLDRMAARAYLAGRFPNVPQNMVQWIRFPQQLKPRTAMPDLGVTDRDARDIAAYLYTLR